LIYVTLSTGRGRGASARGRQADGTGWGRTGTDRGRRPRGFFSAVRYRRAVAITDKVYVENHRQISSRLDASIPRGAFAGATLDLLFTGDVGKLDAATRERALEFAEDFLDCDCSSNPYCGCAERKFVVYLLELRTEGFGPDAIVDVMTDDYMVYAYPGDVRSFLDDAVRTLEAVEAIADVDGDDEAARRAREARSALVG
jgi:superfamily II helicase